MLSREKSFYYITYLHFRELVYQLTSNCRGGVLLCSPCQVCLVLLCCQCQVCLVLMLLCCVCIVLFSCAPLQVLPQMMNQQWNVKQVHFLSSPSPWGRIFLLVCPRRFIRSSETSSQVFAYGRTSVFCTLVMFVSVSFRNLLDGSHLSELQLSQSLLILNSPNNDIHRYFIVH